MKQVNILSISDATHDVVHIVTEKPSDISYTPGQAVDIAINKPEWKGELRPFTFTSLPSDDYLEFYIKSYPDHNGVTEQIGMLGRDESLLVGDVFGDIVYKGEGVFIAGGAGITPFISILKELDKENKIGNNKLIFANNTSDDIIAKEIFEDMLGTQFVNILSRENKEGYKHGYIDKELIKSQHQDDSAYVYLCGPPPMMDSVMEQLDELGVDESRIVKEAF